MSEAARNVTQTFTNACSSAHDFIQEYPKTTAAAATVLAGAAAYLYNPALFALTATDAGYIYDTTAPTLLGKAINALTFQSNEPVTSLSDNVFVAAKLVAVYDGAILSAALGVIIGIPCVNSVPLGVAGFVAGGVASAKYLFNL